MTLMSYADSVLSILPPVAAIVLAILTRKVLLSLGVGIMLGLALLTNFSPAFFASELTSRISGLVWDGERFSMWNINTIGFLLTMGILMSLISASGGTRAFAAWARARINSGKSAKCTVIVLGILIFIDDYFNALLVGNISRPITDQYKISREKLAYCIDSTSAPICVISPISTWGAYIMSILVSLISMHELTGYTPLSLFTAMIPYNFYALSALALLVCVVSFNLTVGPMQAAQERVEKEGQLWDHKKGVPPGEDLGLEEASNGHLMNLIAPIFMLVSLVVSLMLYSGVSSLNEAGKSFSFIGALENADGSWAMVTSGLISIIVTAIAMLMQGMKMSLLAKAAVVGMRSMLTAIWILLMAWTIAGVIGDIETGKYLASQLTGNLPVAALPALIFILSAAAAFSTGTSYGTFAIMLPIAANLAMSMEPSLMLPCLGAVLAGGVFGDHCSPISDTTILSSTGSGCHHIDHVTTQLPYAIIGGLIALVSYVLLGMTGSALLGLSACAVLLATVVFLLSKKNAAKTGFKAIA